MQRMGAQRWSKAKRHAVLPTWSQGAGLALFVVFLAWAGYALLFSSGPSPYVAVPATTPSATVPGPGSTSPTTPTAMVTVQFAQGAGQQQVPAAAVAVAKQAAVAEATGSWAEVPRVPGSRVPAPPASPYPAAATANVTLVRSTGGGYVFFVTTTVSPTTPGDIQVAVARSGPNWVFAPSATQ